MKLYASAFVVMNAVPVLALVAGWEDFAAGWVLCAVFMGSVATLAIEMEKRP